MHTHMHMNINIMGGVFSYFIITNNAFCGHCCFVYFKLIYFWPHWVFIAMCQLSLVAVRGLSMWDLPRPGLKPVSPSLAGRFLTTAPPGSPSVVIVILNVIS